VLEAASLLQAGLLSSREITEACQARIAARNGPVTFDGSPTTVNAWIRLYPDLAQELAAAADALLARARRTRTEAPLLCGVPVGLKDLYAVKGLPLTASSHVLDGNIAPGDSTVWALLKAQGMVLVGHAHTHEFAFGLMTPQCGNPWNLAKSVGGSSGGSAAALAARMVPAATGTDTGGSLRSPPSATGVSALKPTFGLISAHGVIPIGWSIDHAGPMARSAGDLGLLLSALAGPDPADNASLASPSRPQVYPTLPRPGATPLGSVRIGVPDGAAGGLPAPLATLFARAQAELRALGATIVPFTEPDKSSVEFTLDDLGASGVEAGIYHRQFAAKSASYGAGARGLVTGLVAAVERHTGDGVRRAAAPPDDLHPRLERRLRNAATRRGPQAWRERGRGRQDRRGGSGLARRRDRRLRVGRRGGPPGGRHAGRPERRDRTAVRRTARRRAAFRGDRAADRNRLPGAHDISRGHAARAQMSDDPTGTDNTTPALRLVVTTDAEPTDASHDPTGTDNAAPALRLIVPP
jgi:Asp-tRNA(Asn)/Glu-tRNA(Gln) amidotransferase A subunit family amidase